MTSLLFVLVAAAHAASPVKAGFVEALEKIVERSPVVARQKEVVESTRAKYISTGALLWLPTITGQAKAGSVGEAAVTTSNRSVEGVADLNLFRFGADVATSRAASREISSQEHQLQNALLTTEGEGVATLVAYIQAKRQLEVTGRILESRRDGLKVARRRYEKGQLAIEEVDKVSVDFDNSAAQARDAEVDLARAAADLERLLGEPEIVSEWPWKETISKSVPPLLKRSSTDLSQRPDWLAAEARVESADQRAKEAFGDMLPRLDARASYGYFSNETLGVRTTGPAWTAGLTLSVPLFDRLVGYGKYESQIHNRGIAQAELETVKRAAKQDWDSSRATLILSLDTALAREKTLGLARKLYAANLERFNRGILSANDFLIDQDRLYQTETNALKGWAAAHNDFQRLCQAAGRRLSQCLGER